MKQGRSTARAAWNLILILCLIINHLQLIKTNSSVDRTLTVTGDRLCTMSPSSNNLTLRICTRSWRSTSCKVAKLRRCGNFRRYNYHTAGLAMLLYSRIDPVYHSYIMFCTDHTHGPNYVQIRIKNGFSTSKMMYIIENLDYQLLSYNDNNIIMILDYI